MFQDRVTEAADISTAIERKLVALGINKGDDLAMKELAREAMNPASVDAVRAKAEAGDRVALTKFELFGLVGMMLEVMTESAVEDHFRVSGNDNWKAFARELYSMTGRG